MSDHETIETNIDELRERVEDLENVKDPDIEVLRIRLEDLQALTERALGVLAERLGMDGAAFVRKVKEETK